jgi:O-antigen/teichoic acid export membrane protein
MNPDVPSAPRHQALTSGRRLARNAVWNVMAQGVPLAVALIAIPALLRALGVERFGVLALVWALIGYTGLFDLGLGRAMTKLLADRLGHDDPAGIAPLFWTGLVLMTAVGVAGTGAALLIAPWLVTGALTISPAATDETLAAFRVVAIGIPVVTLSAGLRGALEAQQRFTAIAAVNAFLGSLTFLGPLLAVRYGNHLAVMAAVILASRAIAAITYLLLCLRSDRFVARPQFSRGEVGPLLRFGGWMTITNVVGPVMDNMDRFILGALRSVSLVPFYATPYDVVSRILLIPNALTGVLFPAFSTALVGDPRRAANLFVSGVHYLFLALAPVVLLVIVFAKEGLTIWLDADFAAASERILQWLAVGVLISSLARMPYVLLQAAGRPDLTARLHLAELIPYLAAVWWLVERFGALGTAIAWTLRVALDAAVLALMASKRMPDIAERLGSLTAILAGTLGMLILAASLSDITAKLVVCLLGLIAFAAVGRRWLLPPGEFERILGHFQPPDSSP